LETETAPAALRMAQAGLKEGEHPVHHSDRGCQYCPTMLRPACRLPASFAHDPFRDERHGTLRIAFVANKKCKKGTPSDIQSKLPGIAGELPAMPLFQHFHLRRVVCGQTDNYPLRTKTRFIRTATFSRSFNPLRNASRHHASQ